MILVAATDLEPQVEEDVAHLGMVKQRVSILNVIPDLKILVGMMMV